MCVRTKGKELMFRPLVTKIPNDPLFGVFLAVRWSTEKIAKSFSLRGFVKRIERFLSSKKTKKKKNGREYKGKWVG